MHLKSTKIYEYTLKYTKTHQNKRTYIKIDENLPKSTKHVISKNNLNSSVRNRNSKNSFMYIYIYIYISAWATGPTKR